MRSRVTLLAAAVAMISGGSIYLANHPKEEVVGEITLTRVIVVAGKEYPVTLKRKGPLLTGDLPPEVQGKYKIKTFRHGPEVRQELAPIRLDRFRDHGKLWVDENASPSSPGVEGSVFYQWDPDGQINLTALVEFDPSIPGIPPVYA